MSDGGWAGRFGVWVAGREWEGYSIVLPFVGHVSVDSSVLVLMSSRQSCRARSRPAAQLTQPCTL